MDILKEYIKLSMKYKVGSMHSFKKKGLLNYRQIKAMVVKHNDNGPIFENINDYFLWESHSYFQLDNSDQYIECKYPQIAIEGEHIYIERFHDSYFDKKYTNRKFEVIDIEPCGEHSRYTDVCKICKNKHTIILSNYDYECISLNVCEIDFSILD